MAKYIAILALCIAVAAAGEVAKTAEKLSTAEGNYYGLAGLGYGYGYNYPYAYNNLGYAGLGYGYSAYAPAATVAYAAPASTVAYAAPAATYGYNAYSPYNYGTYGLGYRGLYGGYGYGYNGVTYV